MTEIYQRPQRIPWGGYEIPQHRLTWHLESKAIVVLERREENLKARGNRRARRCRYRCECYRCASDDGVCRSLPTHSIYSVPAIRN